MRAVEATLRHKLNLVFDTLFREEGIVDPCLFVSSKSTKKPSKKQKISHDASDPPKNNDDDDDDDDNDNDKNKNDENMTMKGQTILGLFPGDSKEKSTLFSNGLGVDLEHGLHSFVESAAEKRRSEKLFSQTPSDALIVAAIHSFSRKKKRHFFHDALYLTTVFAKEMDMSVSQLLEVRGWLVVKTKDKVSISYRRIGDCLRLLGFEGAMNYFRISSIFDRLFRLMNSHELFPEMAFEKGELLLHLLFSFSLFFFPPNIFTSVHRL